MMLLEEGRGNVKKIEARLMMLGPRKQEEVVRGLRMIYELLGVLMMRLLLMI